MKYRQTTATASPTRIAADNNPPFLVVQTVLHIDAAKENDTQQQSGVTMMLHLSNGQTVRPQDCSLTFCTALPLEIASMNAHSGGTVRYRPWCGDTLVSLEWLGGGVIQTNTTTTTMVDLDQQPLPPLHQQEQVHPSLELAVRRIHVVRELEAALKYSRNGTSLSSLTKVGKELYQSRVTEHLRQPMALRKVMCGLPFCLYYALLGCSLDQMTTRDDVPVVQAWIQIVMEGFQDSDWTKQCKPLMLRVSQDVVMSENEKVQSVMTMTLFQFLNAAGTWFANQREYHAALWCHEKNVAQSVARGMHNSLAHALDALAATHCHFGNYTEAFACVEQSLAIACTNTRVRQAQNLRTVAQGQIGTSGRLAPFRGIASKTPKSLDGVCASCGKGNIMCRAACCRLVWYCNQQCQKTHWVRVHKHTCLYTKSQHSVELK